MCQGIRDVANLSWKLGVVLRGEAQESLLDSYGVERKAHVTELTTRIKAIGQLVGERDMAKARARDAHLLAECGGVVKSVPRQNVQPALQGGLVSPQSHAACGTISPQPWIKQGDALVRLDAIAGAGWRLILAESADALPLICDRANLLQLRTVRVTGTPRPDALCEADGVLAAWFTQHDCVAALVRPDHYVYAVAPTAADILPMVQTAADQAG
jgi:3-(3-hydroxy-phenyl)propionate hydroxylase